LASRFKFQVSKIIEKRKLSSEISKIERYFVHIFSR